MQTRAGGTRTINYAILADTIQIPTASLREWKETEQSKDQTHPKTDEKPKKEEMQEREKTPSEAQDRRK